MRFAVLRLKSFLVIQTRTVLYALSRTSFTELSRLKDEIGS